MSKFTDAIAEHATVRKGPRCALADAITGLGRADAADLRAALDNPAIPSAGISRALRVIDLGLSAATIARHRRGDCVCPR